MSQLPLDNEQKKWLENAMLNPLYVRFPQDENIYFHVETALED